MMLESAEGAISLEDFFVESLGQDVSVSVFSGFETCLSADGRVEMQNGSLRLVDSHGDHVWIMSKIRAAFIAHDELHIELSELNTCEHSRTIEIANVECRKHKEVTKLKITVSAQFDEWHDPSDAYLIDEAHRLTPTFCAARVLSLDSLGISKWEEGKCRLHLAVRKWDDESGRLSWFGYDLGRSVLTDCAAAVGEGSATVATLHTLQRSGTAMEIPRRIAALMKGAPARLLLGVSFDSADRS
jgi:hypothetical protein